MENDVITFVAKRIVELNVATPDTMIGLSDLEISDIEKRLAVRLPNAYQAFLKNMGRAAGSFLQGSDFQYPRLLEFRRSAEHLARAAKKRWKLKPSDFVFFFHQGYIFEYFDCNADKDDPPVYVFTEMEDGPRKVFDHFTDWLMATLEDETSDGGHDATTKPSGAV